MGSTVEQALGELGVVPPTTADALRRAYLRQVKRHPPERDPEGFRRVREAYEFLKDAPWSWGSDTEDGSRPTLELVAALANAEETGRAGEVALMPDARPPEEARSPEFPEERSASELPEAPQETPTPEEVAVSRAAAFHAAMHDQRYRRAGKILLELWDDPALPELLVVPPMRSTRRPASSQASRVARRWSSPK